MQPLIGTSSLHDALIADGFCYLLHAQCTVQIEIYYWATSFEMYVDTCEANRPHAPLRWEHERTGMHSKGWVDLTAVCACNFEVPFVPR